MKISIITGVLNRAGTMESCIKSVLSQTYKGIEYIIIDGGSTDGTLDIINRYKDKIAVTVSSPDKGIYYALNKGIGFSTGDAVGFLHSDDFYAHEKVVERVADVFEREGVDSCYGDLQYVNRDDPGKIIRYWRASGFSYEKFKYGWTLPHPTFFVRKSIYERYGCFNTDFKISADYELMLRFLLKNRISIGYIPEILINMRRGGLSNKGLKNIIIKRLEDYNAWKVNGLKINFGIVFLKNLVKAPQFIRRNNGRIN
ncbi:MAG: glycosyltransferase family 2 protein [Candidatus Omnitrophica bacterium]|nr:glycosyltransferase family 2 protein [Candidatus Omnitrophota bacterium]MDD5553084.1 glycosyltransferase family 2 protein [Candidatus Omnitrophota bacterium]